MPLNILQQSPHDLNPTQDEALRVSPSQKWVPSRYTVRATTDDGRLIVWNTLNGAMSIFKPDQVGDVKRLLRKSGSEEQLAGILKYLVDRGFMVKDGTNEYRKIQLAFGQQHYRNDVLQLILLASEDCNFRCTYCYEDFARGTMQPAVRAATRKLVEKRIKNLRQLHINWFGGEPLYGFAAIEELAPFFIQICAENSVRFRSNMTTNGYLLTPEVAEKLLAWQITRFQITLDGRPEDHDRSRPTRNGQGSFWTIIENLKALSRRTEDYEVALRVNFDRNNHPHMTEFMDIIKREIGDDPRFQMRFHGVGRWGGQNDEQLDVCGPDEAAQIRYDLKQEARKRGISIGRGLKDVSGFGNDACYAARPFNFIIGASGKLMKCTVALDKDDANVVGRLTEQGDLEIDRDKLALWTEPAFESDSKCKKCVILPACQGLHCPLVRMEEHRSPCSPVRLNLKHALRETSEILETGRQVPLKLESPVAAS
ncbi:MAG TPA: radical SAM protein [Thermoanaerobaculia bacterium]